MLFTLMIALIVIVATFIYAWAEYRSLLANMAVSESVVKNAVPFERILAQPKRRILVLGDSTGVGVGAIAPQLSLAGRLAADYPDAEVTNRAASGAKVRDVAGQLAAVGAVHFDLVYLQIGGNDIVRFTPLAELEKSLAAVIEKTRGYGDQVVVATCGNVGAAPICPKALQWLMRRRTLSVRKIFLATVRGDTVHFIDLFREEKGDPFSLDPNKYYAADSFHPNAFGYGVWYSEIRGHIKALPGWSR